MTDFKASNKRIFSIAYGMNRELLAEQGRDCDFETLKESIWQELRNEVSGEFDDIEISMIDWSNEFSVSAYPLEFNGNFDGYERLKENMIESYQLLSFDAFNAIEKQHRGQLIINRAEYIESLTNRIFAESCKLGTFLDVIGSGLIKERLLTAIPDAAFHENKAPNYFDRFMLLSECLSSQFWEVFSDELIYNCLSGVESKLVTLANEFGLSRLITDTGFKSVFYDTVTEKVL